MIGKRDCLPLAVLANIPTHNLIRQLSCARAFARRLQIGDQPGAIRKLRPAAAHPLVGAMLMCTLREARVNAARQARIGMEEAGPILMQEGGISEVLKFLAFLTQGEVLPAPLVLRLKQEAAKIHSAKVHSA